MPFDGLKNLFNMRIDNGVPGRAVVQSSSIPAHASSYNVHMWLDVYVDGWEPYRTEHECMVRADKHPHPGTTLPVTVDPENRERMRVEWDEIQTVDERMAAGAPGQVGGAPSVQTINLRAGEQVPPEIQQMLAGAGIDLSAMTAARTAGAEQQPDAVDQVADQLDLIEKLGELRAAGLLTDAEFEAKKAEILRGAS